MRMANLKLDKFMAAVKGVNAALSDQNRYEEFLNDASTDTPIIRGILEQLAILLNREIAVKFVQYVLRIGRGFDAFLVIQCPSIHGIQHLTPFKFDRGVDAFIHKIRQRAFGAAKTAVNGVPPIWGNALGDVNRRRVEFTCVPKTTRPAGACPNVLKHVALVKTQLQMV